MRLFLLCESSSATVTPLPPSFGAPSWKVFTKGGQLGNPSQLPLEHLSLFRG